MDEHRYGKLQIQTVVFWLMTLCIIVGGRSWTGWTVSAWVDRRSLLSTRWNRGGRRISPRTRQPLPPEKTLQFRSLKRGLWIFSFILKILLSFWWQRKKQYCCSVRRHPLLYNTLFFSCVSPKRPLFSKNSNSIYVVRTHNYGPEKDIYIHTRLSCWPRSFL